MVLGSKKNADVSILVVEDDELNREILFDILEEENFDVELAGDGNDAVQLYKACQFPIILMDIMMPKMDGREAAQEISRIAKDYGKTASIIAVTAADIDTEKSKLLGLGFCDFVAKPFNEIELLSSIKKHYPHAHYHKAFIRNDA